MNLPELYAAIAEALGWTLLHSLWQGLLLFLLIFTLLRFLRDHSPQVRYLLLCCSVIMLSLVMIATFLYYFDLPSLPLSDADIWLKQVSGAAPALPDNALQTSPRWQAVFWDRLSTFMQVYAGHLATVWLLGAFFFALRWVGIFYLTNRLRATAHYTTPFWGRKLKELAEQMGLRRPVFLRESAHIDVPMVLGHFKPVILLPVGSMIGLSPQQLEAVLLHELAHVHRNDYLTNLMLSCLEIILFYHPLYWWLTDRIMQEREQCCDDIAVAICGNARLYAKTLLLMEEKRQQNTLAMAYQGKKHHLLDRIKRICLTAGRPYRREMGRAGFALILLLGVAVVTWAQLPTQSSPTEIKATTQDLPSTVEMAVISTPPTPPTAVTQQAQVLSQAPASSSDAIPATVPNHRLASKAAIRHPRVDTLPPPNIPAMQQAPALPELPRFSFDLSSENLKDERNRAEMRKQIEQYEKQLDDWKKQVDEQHMSHWRARQDQLRQLFQNWRDDLKTKYADNELQYGIALNQGSEYFEDALEELEDAVEESEDYIEDRVEDYLEDLEDTVEDFEDVLEDEEEEAKNHEERMAKHRERMAVHQDRMSMHRLRMGMHRARLDMHRQRIDMHRDRMSIHRERMDAHREIMESFKKAFFAQLEKDGLYSKNQDQFEFLVKSDKIIVNGKVLTEQQARPYLELLEKHGMTFPTGDEEWRYSINGGNTSIGLMHRSHK